MPQLIFPSNEAISPALKQVLTASQIDVTPCATARDFVVLTVGQTAAFAGYILSATDLRVLGAHGSRLLVEQPFMIAGIPCPIDWVAASQWIPQISLEDLQRMITGKPGSTHNKPTDVPIDEFWNSLEKDTVDQLPQDDQPK